ncbi:MAG: hypothetical protein BWZ01_01950 [Deltaproteobacteria bacterium ADurb.BinA179]|nr:MAG: hypothetical protein BWZ01_01950 [Deltaproteobacteria bacterium ADurb.BinA179]
MSAGLALPPGIGDRAPAAAHLVVEPPPCLGVERLSHRTQDPQRGEVVHLDPLVAFFRDCADSGRRSVEVVDVVLLDNGPEPVIGRIAGYALEHDARVAVAQRAIDDVAVAGHPPDVGRAPVDVFIAHVECIFLCHGRIEEIPCRGMEHPLGLSGRSGGVENEQGIFGVHLLGLAVHRGLGHEIFVPDIAAFLHRDLGSGAPDNDHGLDGRALIGCLVGIGLLRDSLVAAIGSVAGDEHLGIAVFDPVSQGLGREASENDRMQDPDPGACQHGDDQLRNHGKVNGYHIPFLKPEVLEYVGELVDLAVQVPKGIYLPVVGVVAFENNGCLVLLRFQVPVNTVVGRVELSAHKPLHVQVVAEGPVGNLVLVERFEPGQSQQCLLCPEGIRILDGLFIHLVILSPALDVGFLSYPVGNWKNLVKKILIGVGHYRPPSPSFSVAYAM